MLLFPYWPYPAFVKTTDGQASNNDKFIKIWPYRLIVRTQASQAWNSGAIPGEVTKHLHEKEHTAVLFFCAL